MHRSLKKGANHVKGRLKQRQGPATKDQATAPIADAIADFWARDMLTFGIPAHNGGRGPAPEFTKWAGMDAARADLPTSHGLDTRDRAWEVQATAQELFAEATGGQADAVLDERLVAERPRRLMSTQNKKLSHWYVFASSPPCRSPAT
jgi:hypothetical protein